MAESQTSRAANADRQARIFTRVILPVVGALFLAVLFVYVILPTWGAPSNCSRPTGVITVGSGKVDGQSRNIYQVPEGSWMVIQDGPNASGELPAQPFFVLLPGQVYAQKAVWQCETPDAANQAATELNKGQFAQPHLP